MAYDDVNNTIYLSSRHLSRIYKINLDSGDIEWSMGYDLTGNGNVSIQLNDENGIYHGFTFQHGLQLLENGNIVTLDNGNISQWLFEEYNDEPRTRALEISIDESNNKAEIVWEYLLADTLYGHASGNVQKLNNGNYLITTIGDQGHTLEVNSNGELVSDLHYKLDILYRADRILSIHPYGCMDKAACNYDINARVNDESCDYPEGIYDCDGNCFNQYDDDGDGICNIDDNCPQISNSNQSNYDNDAYGDLCDDDDDDDGLKDCWDNWYIDGLQLTEQEKNDLIANDVCQDFALEIDSLAIVPNNINLYNPYPNPFNPIVNFDIDINHPSKINIDIYSINGVFIKSIYNGYMNPGSYSFEWNGSQHSSGLYIINLTYNNNFMQKKVLLLK